MAKQVSTGAGGKNLFTQLNLAVKLCKTERSAVFHAVWQLRDFNYNLKAKQPNQSSGEWICCSLEPVAPCHSLFCCLTPAQRTFGRLYLCKRGFIETKTAS